MLDAIRSLFGKRPDDESASASGGEHQSGDGSGDPLHIAACALLLDIAWADGEFSNAERRHLEETLERHFGLPPESGRKLIEIADAERREAIDHFRFTSVLKKNYDLGQKMVLAEVMWSLVLSDGRVAEHEHYLSRKIANLLDLEPAYLSSAKKSAAERASPSGD